MRIPAGQRDRKVEFYPRVYAEDATGVEQETDGTPIAAKAYVSFGSGAERREAGQAGSQQTATFRVLSNAALRAADARWQIAFEGARWGIISVVPIGEAQEIEFTATRKGA